MPKQKTNSSAKKRFRVTATGKVRFKRAYKNHILTKKTKKQKRGLRANGVLQTTEMSNIRFMLRF